MIDPTEEAIAEATANLCAGLSDNFPRELARMIVRGILAPTAAQIEEQEAMLAALERIPKSRLH